MWSGVLNGLVGPAERPVTAWVGGRDAPLEVTAPTSLDRVDYVDRFTMSTRASASPEGWARAMFGDEPSAGERLIWRGLLGLRLVPGRSSGTVAGWPVTGRGPDRIRLATRSPLLSANLVVAVEDGAVAVTTALRFEEPAGRWLWTPASALHRALVPGVLRRAEAVVGRRAAAAGTPR
jgi:hypothetical protein